MPLHVKMWASKAICCCACDSPKWFRSILNVLFHCHFFTVVHKHSTYTFLSFLIIFPDEDVPGAFYALIEFLLLFFCLAIFFFRKKNRQVDKLGYIRTMQMHISIEINGDQLPERLWVLSAAKPQFWGAKGQVLTATLLFPSSLGFFHSSYCGVPLPGCVHSIFWASKGYHHVVIVVLHFLLISLNELFITILPSFHGPGVDMGIVMSGKWISQHTFIITFVVGTLLWPHLFILTSIKKENKNPFPAIKLFNKRG